MTTPAPHKRSDDDHRTQFQHRRHNDGFHRWLPLLGYVILVAAIAWTINGVRQEGVERRGDLAASAKTVVLEGCERDNDTREILRNLIRAGDDTIRQYRAEGLLTPEQTDRALRQNREAIERLPNVDCQNSAEKLLVETTKRSNDD